MKILVYGSGYVGLVTSVCLADTDNIVDCLDIDINKVNQLNSGKSSIYEPNLEPLLKRGLKNKHLNFISKLVDMNYDAIFICVGTPDDSSGRADLQYIYNVADEIANKTKSNQLIFIKSTVPVGTCSLIEERINKKIKLKNIKVSVSSCPEFLREGSAILDFQKPARVIIGSKNIEAINTAKQIFAPYTHMTSTFMVMGRESSELTKYASNSFLATKISFMNQLAIFSDKVGANINDVRKGMSLDPRIEGKFLFSGIGYGGSCFPKDVKSLISQANDSELSMSILTSVDDVNQNQWKYLYKLFKDNIDANVKKVAVFGLAFKPNTDDIRYAPSIEIVKNLISDGMDINVYDPVATNNFSRIFSDSKINYMNDIYSLVNNCDALIICTEWSHIFNVNLDKIKDHMRGSLVLDGRNCLNKEDWESKGFKYYGIGIN